MDRLQDRARAYLGYATLAAAMLGGGGGGPLLDLAIELLGLALLVATLAGRSPGLPVGARPAIAVVLLVAAIPLVQLVPLPASLWRGLPGRELAVAARDALGVGGRSFPLTLDPEATWRSAVFLIPPIALFLATLRAGVPERRRLILIAIAGVAVNLLAGTLQVALGDRFYPYPTAHRGNAVGLLVNRNHFATLMLIGIVLLPMLIGRDRPPARAAHDGGFLQSGGRWLLAAAMVLFALAVIPSISRAGMLAMPLVLVAGLLRLAPRGLSRSSLAALAAVALVAAGLAALLAVNGVTQSTAARFLVAGQDARPGFWTDTIAAIGPFWPAGSGIGTFVPVYASFQSLETLGPYYVNHAHQEYLELLLEAGMAAAVAFVAYLVAIVVALRRRLGGMAGQQRTCALIGIAVVLAHSAVDYPLRVLTVSTLFGLLHALLFAPAPSDMPRRAE